jgi:predicted O-linked N-acetylglucosamine transferase (SPINDLY family)
VLARAELQELVADSGRDYIAVSAKYAREAAFRADLRAKLHANSSRGRTTAEQHQPSPSYQALAFALNETAKNG